MAEAVTSLLRDPGRSRAIGRAARAYILANWTWEALFERQEKVLAEIAGV
jgi:glycosyltransferase involved in cell wall biosynthesis